MSIALDMKVAALEAQVLELSGRTVELMKALREDQETMLQMALRLERLEGKAAPKRSSNG